MSRGSRVNRHRPVSQRCTGCLLTEPVYKEDGGIREDLCRVQKEGSIGRTKTGENETKKRLNST